MNRALTPVDLSDTTLYTTGAWRDAFAALRASAPVSYRTESPYGAYWSVVTHDLIQQVELDTETFSSSYELGGIAIAENPAGGEFPTFIMMDPPRHTEPRKVIAPAFSPSQMAMRETEVVERTRALLDNLPLGETFCWVDQVAVPLTIGMLAILFGFPWEDRMKLREWSDMASNVSPEVMTPEYSAKFMVEMGQMMMHFDALMDTLRNQPPTDDLLSRMVHSQAMGDLSPIERLANIVVLIVGGNDTTRNSMAGLIEALDRYPDQLDALRADPSLIANAAQEIIRWQSPVAHMRRTCTRDVELAGQHLAKGDKVLLWYISANRDEAVFKDAERFDAARENARRHLAFGHGVHRCVGARLAELQLTTLIRELLDRRLRVVPDGAPTRLSSPFLHGFTAMPVHLEQI